MRVTFHRAIDMARDPVEAVAAVISAGCDKILTSGGAVTAMDGAATIRDMHTAGDGKVDLIAAAGVTEHNAVAMLQVRTYVRSSVGTRGHCIYCAVV